MDTARPRWSRLQLLGFHFLFVYFTLFVVPIVFSEVPWLDYLSKQYSDGADWLARQSARTVFDIELESGQPTGSGDRTIDYVEIFDLAVVSMAIALIWTVLAIRVPSYRYLPAILWTVLRWGLASMMLVYGFIKLIPPTQFPEPPYYRLMQPYGESSPMGLLWTFMGASQPYTHFGGAMEVLGGLLLLFRHTAMLGSLVSIAVMGNIVAMNFCYDVPVKLFSLHYLVMAFILAWWDRQRLLYFFVLNRTVVPADLKFPLPPMRPRWERNLRRLHLVIKLIAVAGLIGALNYQQFESRKQFGGGDDGPLHGGYEVEKFVWNGQELPVSGSDARCWRAAEFYNSKFVRIRTGTGARLQFRMDVNDESRNVTFIPVASPGKNETWNYSFPANGSLELTGTLNDGAIRVTMKKGDRSQFLLVNRGFHWINEFPFNR